MHSLTFWITVLWQLILATIWIYIIIYRNDYLSKYLFWSFNEYDDTAVPVWSTL